MSAETTDTSSASEEFKGFFRRYASGVMLLTVTDAEGVTHGMTATSVMSLTVEPPSLVASVSSDARTAELIRQSGEFGVSVLASGQTDIAMQCATPGSDKRLLPEQLVAFPGVGEQGEVSERKGDTQPSAVRGALGGLRCEAHSIDRKFTHDVIVGRVTDGLTPEEPPAEALVYMNGRFEPLPMEANRQPPPTAAPETLAWSGWGG